MRAIRQAIQASLELSYGFRMMTDWLQSDSLGDRQMVRQDISVILAQLTD